jgi:lipopolysaccharide export system protein LptA
MILETGIGSNSRWVPACIACLLALSAIAVEPLKPGKQDTIVVRADQAWEDPDESITYYRGNFELSTPDWSVQAAEATVFGPLNNPERVLLDGEPARIWISQPEKSKIVEGSGATIEYLLSADLVTLSGGAELRDGEDTVTSDSILYDIEKDSYRSGNSGRVKVSITPRKN